MLFSNGRVRAAIPITNRAPTKAVTCRSESVTKTFQLPVEPADERLRFLHALTRGALVRNRIRKYSAVFRLPCALCIRHSSTLNTTHIFFGEFNMRCCSDDALRTFHSRSAGVEMAARATRQELDQASPGEREHSTLSFGQIFRF